MFIFKFKKNPKWKKMREFNNTFGLIHFVFIKILNEVADKANQAIPQPLNNSFKQLNRVSVPHFILRKTSNLKWNRTKYNFFYYSSTWYLFLIHIPYTVIFSSLLFWIMDSMRKYDKKYKKKGRENKDIILYYSLSL